MEQTRIKYEKQQRAITREQEAQEGLYMLYWFKFQLAEDFFKVFPIYRYVKHLTPPPLGRANFNPRAMI